jgi:hypothetical protein
MTPQANMPIPAPQLAYTRRLRSGTWVGPSVEIDALYGQPGPFATVELWEAS